MMGLTADGQADQKLILQRDSRLGISTAHKRASRADIPTPEVAPGANPGRAAGPSRLGWMRWASDGGAGSDEDGLDISFLRRVQGHRHRDGD